MSETKETVCVSKQREERKDQQLGLRTGSGAQLALKHINLSSLGLFFRRHAHIFVLLYARGCTLT